MRKGEFVVPAKAGTQEQATEIPGFPLSRVRFLRIAPIYDPEPLDPRRRLAALLTLVVFILCFMPAPVAGL